RDRVQGVPEGACRRAAAQAGRPGDRRADPADRGQRGRAAFRGRAPAELHLHPQCRARDDDKPDRQCAARAPPVVRREGAASRRTGADHHGSGRVSALPEPQSARQPHGGGGRRIPGGEGSGRHAHPSGDRGCEPRSAPVRRARPARSFTQTQQASGLRRGPASVRRLLAGEDGRPHCHIALSEALSRLRAHRQAAAHRPRALPRLFASAGAGGLIGVRQKKGNGMSILSLESFAAGRWLAPSGKATILKSAVTGADFAEIGAARPDFAAMIEYARSIGGPALRAMTFHERAFMLKALAQYLNERREALYELSYETGATKADCLIDVDGGIGTLFVYSSKGRRELPDDTILVEGAVEQLSRSGSFVGQHVATPLRGVAVHINAFNFPVWGMLEKLSPTL